MNVFIGRVAENKYYAETGYIDVVAFQLGYEAGLASQLRNEFSLKDIQDLIPSYKDGLVGDGVDVCRCRILSPLGAGKNYGMFSMPQVNSVGLVLELDNFNSEYWSSNDRYIWLGGLYGGKMYDEVLTLPNDDTDELNLNHEDNAYTSRNEDESTEDTITDSPYVNEGMFLIKLKTSKTDADVDNEKKQQHVHFDTIPSEAEFVMRKNKITLRHNKYDEEDVRIGYSDLAMDNQKVQISRITNNDGDDEKREEQIEVFDGDKIQLQFLNKDTKIDRKLTLDNDKADLQFDDPDNNKNLSLQLNNSDNFIDLNLTKDSTTNQVKIEEDKITINANNKATIKLDKDGNITISAEGKCNIETKQETKIEASGDCKVTGMNVDVEAKVSCKVKGLTVDVKGTSVNVKGTAVSITGENGMGTGAALTVGGVAAPTGSGPFCGIPVCPIVGVPHAGSIVAGF